MESTASIIIDKPKIPIIFSTFSAKKKKKLSVGNRQQAPQIVKLRIGDRRKMSWMFRGRIIVNNPRPRLLESGEQKINQQPREIEKENMFQE